MITRKLWWIAGGVLVASALVSATVFAWQPWRSPDLLTERQVQAVVLEQYPGEIVQSRRQGEAYLLQLQSDQGSYELEVRAIDGTILAIQRLDGPGGTPVTAPPEETDNGVKTLPPETKPPTPAPLPTNGSGGETGAGGETSKPPTTGAPATKPPATQPPAVKPPATQPPAETKPPLVELPVLSEQQASSIALKHVKGNGQVEGVQRGKHDDYLVDIEMEDGREAVVQVNMISGKVMSVTWDDDADSDSDNSSGDDNDD